MKKDDRVELAAIREQLLEAVKGITDILEKYAPKRKELPCGCMQPALNVGEMCPSHRRASGL